MRKIIIGIVAVLVLIQFIPVDRENPVFTSADEIIINTEIKEILERSCYDCHSNKTVWPAYSYVAPISWLVASHVKDGRKELNFTEWNSYSDKRKSKKLEEMMEEVTDDKMPLPPYLILHAEAELTQNNKQILKDGINALVTEMPQKD